MGSPSDAVDHSQGSETGAREGEGTACHAEERYLPPEVLDAIGAMVVVLDPDGRIVRFNHACEELTGYRFSDVRGQPVWNLAPPDTVDAAKQYLGDMVSSGVPVECEMEWVARDGTRRLVLWSHSVLGEAGRVHCIVGTGIDVTERRRAEEASRFLSEAGRALASSLDYETTLAEIARLAVPILGDWCVIFVVEGENVRRASVVPADPSKADLARRLMSMPPPVLERARPVVEAVRSLRPQLMPVVTEEVLQALATSPEHLDVLHEMAPTTALTVPLVLHGELLGGVHLFFTEPGRRYTDTDARLAEEFASRASLAVGNARLYQRAQEATRRSEAIFEALPDLYFILGADGTYLDIRAGRASNLYAPAAELLGRTIHEMLPREVAEEVQSGIDRVLRTDALTAMEYSLTIGGEARAFEGRMVPLRNDAVVLIVRDVTELRRAEAELWESKERFRTLVEFTSDWIWEVDANDVYTYASPKVRDLLGYEPQEVVGKTPWDLMPPDEVERVRPVYCAAKAARRAFSALDNRNLAEDGHEVVLETNGVPILDEHGELRGYRGIDRDMTERRRAEEERARLLESERRARAEAQEANQAKDQFLAVLSHELRNPLAPILAGVSILRRAAPDDERLRRVVDIIDRNVKLQARLVDDLLDMSRIARGKIRLERMPLTLDSVVNAAADVHQADAAQAGLTLEIETRPGLWVLGDPDRLQQVVMNLLTNAIKFTPAGGVVRVGVRECEGVGDAGMGRGGDAEREGRGDAETGPGGSSPEIGAAAETHTPRCARIAVEDTGVGIPRELLPHLFGMFRQGEVGGKRASGLGIGLALVKSLAEAHGGRVWAESEGPGKGSRFAVELPLIPAPGLVEPQVRDGAAPRKLTLLLVEDNEDTRALLADGLAEHDYKVLQAASGEEALEVLQRDHPDAVLSDIGLPGMDGYEMLRRARALPGMSAVPAFAVTGYGDDEDVRRAREAGYAGHFTKPVDTEALDRRIREQVEATGMT